MKLIYHIYYSFYGIDRLLHVPNEKHGFYTPILADDFMGITMFGYIIGCLFYMVAPVLMIFHLGPSVSRTIGCITIAVAVLLLFYLWRIIIKHDAYSVYFDEFDKTPNYPHYIWNTFSFFVFIVAMILGVNSVLSLLYGFHWLSML